ncbi:hypothetical protein HMPREF1142_0991 [Peptostreptococcaceae bacterium AS15]|nr:hypothetical protein HMPREF1142_0991 [Peptostreptococcaceae bacterium AS15]
MKNVIDKKTYMEIAKLLIDDENVLFKLKTCFDNPLNFFEENSERYDDRGIDRDEDVKTIAWIAIADELIEGGFAVELDWKEELSEFVWQMKGLADKNNLELYEECLDENDDIPTWCRILDGKWREKNYCIGAMDINSDSYLMFVCKLKTLQKLALLSTKIGRRFNFAKLI